MNRAQRRAAARDMPELPKDAYEKVVIGYIHPGDTASVFNDCVDRLKRYELARRNAWIATISKQAGSGHLAGARNFVTETFLQGSGDWLLFIDADMGFPEWAVERMLGVATHGGELRPIVGGLCFALSTVEWDPVTNAEYYEAFPTVGIWNRAADGTILGYRYLTQLPEETEILKVDSTGAAMVMIHRSAFETIGKEWWTPLEVPEGAPGLDGRGYFGEDISFFIRCAEHGLPVWLDTMVETSHYKHFYVTRKTYEQQEAAKCVSQS